MADSVSASNGGTTPEDRGLPGFSFWRAPYEQATIFAGRFLLGTRQGMTPGLHAVGDVCTGG